MPTYEIVLDDNFWQNGDTQHGTYDPASDGNTYTIDGSSFNVDAIGASKVPAGKTIIIKNSGDLNQESATRFVNSGTIIIEDSSSRIQVANNREFGNTGFILSSGQIYLGSNTDLANSGTILLF